MNNSHPAPWYIWVAIVILFLAAYWLWGRKKD